MLGPAILNARPKDRLIAAPGVYDMVSLRMAARWDSTLST